MVNRTYTSLKNFWQIISFVCVRNLLEPVRKLAEVYLRFKNIEEILYMYKQMFEEADERFQSVYVEAITLANKAGTEEKWSCPCEQ